MQQTATAPPRAGPARTWEATYPGTADQVPHGRWTRWLSRTEEAMQPPDPPPPPGAGYASPARVAADLTRQLGRHGIIGIYTVAAEKLAVISVTADLTVWTNGQLLWCTHHGQRHTWAAADIETAATSLAALARPAGGS